MRAPGPRGFGTGFVAAATGGFGLFVTALWCVQIACFTPLPVSALVVGRTPIYAQGQLLADGRDGQGRRFVRADDNAVNSTVAGALIASEDRRLFAHPGVDVRALARAAWQALRHGRVGSGASTMAMQLVRLREGRRPGLDPFHKLRDMILALRLTRRLGAAGVLRAYLDEVPLGPHEVGVGAASQRFFGKPANTLSIAEASVLATFARAPSIGVRASHSDEARERVIKRAESVVHEMVRRSQASAADAWGVRVAASSLVGERAQGRNPALVRRLIQEGATRATIDPLIQEAVEEALRAGLRATEQRGISHGAAIVVELRGMRVRAAVTVAARGDAWFDGTLSKRQPGSTLKPFLVAMALEADGASTISVQDTPIMFAGDDDAFEPRNYDGLFHGDVPIEDVLARSLNVATLRLAGRVGVPAFLQRLRDAGFVSLEAGPDHYGTNLALGDGETSLTELAEAYGCLANDGVHQTLSWDENKTASMRRVFEEDVARMVTNMLDDDRRRSPTFARDGSLSPSFPMAAKTGTSRGHRDSWAIGYGRTMLAAVWMGRADGGPTREVNGARGPAPVVRTMLERIERGREAFPFPDAARWLAATECLGDGGKASPVCARERLTFRRAGDEKSGGAASLAGHTRIGRGAEEMPHFTFPAQDSIFVYDAARGASGQGLRVRVDGPAGEGSLRVRNGNDVVVVQSGRAIALPLRVGLQRLLLEQRGRVIDVRDVRVQ